MSRYGGVRVGRCWGVVDTLCVGRQRSAGGTCESGRWRRKRTEGSRTACSDQAMRYRLVCPCVSSVMV